MLTPTVSWAEQNQEHFQSTTSLSCFNYLGSKANLILGDFDPKEVWLSLGLDPSRVSLFFIKEFHFAEGAILFQLEYNHRTIARTNLIQNENIESVWHTELTLLFDDKFKGKGLGFFMYLLAAARFYEDYPEYELHGSGNQSQDAQKLWQRLVDSGFAKQFETSQTDLEGISNGVKLIKEALGPKLMDYVRPYGVFTPRLD